MCGGSIVRQRRGTIAGLFIQLHDQAVKALLQWIDGQCPASVSQGCGPIMLGGVGFGGAFQCIEHALLPGGTLELQPLVPI